MGVGVGCPVLILGGPAVLLRGGGHLAGGITYISGIPQHRLGEGLRAGGLTPECGGGAGLAGGSGASLESMQNPANNQSH